MVKKGLVSNLPVSSKVFEPMNILGKRVLGTSYSKINVSGPILVKKGMVPNFHRSVFCKFHVYSEKLWKTIAIIVCFAQWTGGGGTRV